MRSRLGSVTAAMAGVAVLALLLTAEAARSARERRQTAERVLTDYAALAADGLVVRLQAFLAGRLFPILSALADRIPATAPELAAGLGPAAADLARSVSWSGHLGTDLATISYLPDVSRPAGLAEAIRAATVRLPDAAYFGMIPAGDALVVFAPRQPNRPNGQPAYALPLAALEAAVGRGLAADPVLPAALTHGAAVGDEVRVVVSLGNHVVARRGVADSTRFVATRSLGPVYGGMAVEVALAESIAPTLLIGGLPPSRLPFLATVMTLTIALAAGAVWQLRQKERLARLRDDFVAGASHELRTPLAQIRLFAETLRLERVRSDEERAGALAVIEREARRLEHLVENLLHFSRAERGALRVATEPVDLAALTREIVADFLPLAEKAGVPIRVEGPASVTAPVDPGAWRQIALNLLDNAVKYGGRRQRVVVTIQPRDGFAELTVADGGPGVSAADRDRIWEPFGRGDAARVSGVTGTGIGLATVRDLVALHHGDCRVEPGEPSGARFVIRVPATG
ncbi:MAG: sensor histidine kinase [Gemmatimonadales bacterium]